MENPQYKTPTQQKQEQETRSKTQIYVYYDWGHIPEHEKPVTLDQAIDFLKKQPNKSQFESNFIGFNTKTSDQVIQFINLGNERWHFDIPIYAEFRYKYDWTHEVFIASDSFSKVILLVEEYFKQEEIFNSLQTYNYDAFLRMTSGMGIEWEGYISIY